MCSVPGYDASGWVDDLAAEQNKPCTSIAIGKFPQQCLRSFAHLHWVLHRRESMLRTGLISNLLILGSAEGFSLADKAINSATKSGR